MLFGKKFKQNGFTLVEMLLTTALVVCVAVSISVCFMQGSKIYERLNRSKDYEESAFFLQKITRDIRNGINFSVVPFSGTKKTISFAKLEFDSGKDVSPIGAMPVVVTYTYDDRRKVVIRSRRSPFPKAMDIAERKEVVAAGVSSFEFRFEQIENKFPDKISVVMRMGDKTRSHLLIKNVLSMNGYDPA